MRRSGTEEYARLVRIGGLIAWVMVGLPVVLHGGIEAFRLAAWAAVYALFPLALWAGAARPRATWLLVVEILCVTSMVLLLCDGFEGALLVFVALQLGERFPARVAALWVVMQTGLLAGAISLHWAPSAALLLAPPYLGFQLLAVLVARLVARHDAARQELARANDDLVAAQAVAQENTRLGERLRIARDLHDVVGHRLTALSLNLEAAAQLAEGPAGEPVAAARALAKDLLADVRDVVSELRDDDRMDLASALRALATEMPRPSVHLSLPTALPDSDPARALTILRCAQEIVTNAAKHANAENLWIDVTHNHGALALHARDDGGGAADVALGGGLRGMRERLELEGGRLEVATSPGKGFSVRATLPARGASA